MKKYPHQTHAADYIGVDEVVKMAPVRSYKLKNLDEIKKKVLELIRRLYPYNTVGLSREHIMKEIDTIFGEKSEMRLMQMDNTGYKQYDKSSI